MDPLSMTLALASGGLKGAAGAMSIFGALSGNRAAKRATRMKIAGIRDNIEMAGKQTAFDQSRLYDQVDAVQGQQVNFFAGGNIDPTSGSPAIVQAMTAAQGETDAMLIGAKGAKARADGFQQIADLETQQSDRNNAMAFGVGSTLLDVAQSWVGLGNYMNKQGAFAGSASAGAPMNMPASGSRQMMISDDYWRGVY